MLCPSASRRQHSAPTHGTGALFPSGAVNDFRNAADHLRPSRSPNEPLKRLLVDRTGSRLPTGRAKAAGARRDRLPQKVRRAPGPDGRDWPCTRKRLNPAQLCGSLTSGVRDLSGSATKRLEPPPILAAGRLVCPHGQRDGPPVNAQVPPHIRCAESVPRQGGTGWTYGHVTNTEMVSDLDALDLCGRVWMFPGSLVMKRSRVRFSQAAPGQRPNPLPVRGFGHPQCAENVPTLGQSPSSV